MTDQKKDCRLAVRISATKKTLNATEVDMVNGGERPVLKMQCDKSETECWVMKDGVASNRYDD